MSFIDVFLAPFAPFDCLGCRVEGKLICNVCIKQLHKPSPLGCYRCLRPTTNSLTCIECYKQSTSIRRVQAATVYDGIAKDVLWRLKSNGTQAAARLMAEQMRPLLTPEPDKQLIVPVPTATTRARQRGYDQAVLIAKHISRLSGIRLAQCLIRQGQTHQVGSNRQQRLEQLQTAYRVKHKLLVKDSVIILVDDVMTTGATLEAAAAVLDQFGAYRIEGLVFARSI